MSTPSQLLPYDSIKKLHDVFDRDDLNATLAKTLTDMYQLTTDYLKAIGEAFYHMGTTPPQGDVITPANRERCLITLLAARGAGFTLAVHIYIALMEGFIDHTGLTQAQIDALDELSPEEIANIIFLSGIYTGSDNMMRGLVTMEATLGVLKGVADGTGSKAEADVLKALQKAYLATLL
jgi:alkylhydroperoxidase/carboxymuconolactone decarboxylase family protein YurZ